MRKFTEKRKAVRRRVSIALLEFKLLPTENLVSKRLDFSTSLNNDDGENDKTPKHHNQSNEIISHTATAGLKNRIVVIAENCASNRKLSYKGNKADKKPFPEALFDHQAQDGTSISLFPCMVPLLCPLTISNYFFTYLSTPLDC